MMGNYPHGCELDAISTAAISACDGLDGVVDGVITDPDACLDNFDPFQLVGTSINCSETDSQIQISAAAAAVCNATWHGALTADGRQTWHGLSPGADLTGSSPAANGQPGLVATNCSSGTCVGSPNILGLQWLQLFVAKDPDFSFDNLTHAEFDRLVHASKQEFRSIINTDDPDLSAFRNAGGKMVSFHGLVRLTPMPRQEQLINRTHHRPIMSSLQRAPSSITMRLPPSYRMCTTSIVTTRFLVWLTATAAQADCQLASLPSCAPGWKMARYHSNLLLT